MLQNTERGQAVRRLKQWNAAEEYVTNPCVGLCMWNLHPQRPRICLADARGLLRAANVTVHSSHSYPIISWGALYHILRAYLLITLLLLGKDTWKAKTSREVFEISCDKSHSFWFCWENPIHFQCAPDSKQVSLFLEKRRYVRNLLATVELSLQGQF